jgi:hypothetical protein
MAKLIGTDPNQVPTNGDLGDLAYQNKESVKVESLTASADGVNGLTVNRDTSDGDIVQFRKDGTTVGSIGNVGTYLTIGSDDTGLAFAQNLNSIIPHNTSTNAYSDAAVDLGYSTVRFKDLYLSGGVYLGGTGSANHLDDYEEGTWTPSMSYGSVTADKATYVKIGRQVTVCARLTDITDNTSAQNVYVNGLPFTVSADGNSAQGAVLIRYINVGRGFVTTQAISSSTYTGFVGSSSDTSTNWHTLQYSDATTVWDLQFSLTYQTDS